MGIPPPPNYEVIDILIAVPLRGRAGSTAWKRIRMVILCRDDWRCQDCGIRKRLTIHHIVPRTQGGSDHPDNLVTLCRTCHDAIHK